MGLKKKKKKKNVMGSLVVAINAQVIFDLPGKRVKPNQDLRQRRLQNTQPYHDCGIIIVFEIIIFKESDSSAGFYEVGAS